MDKTRRFKRFNVDIMNITGRIALSNVVKIKDMYSHGLNICTDVRLDIGREYNLKLEESGQSIIVKGVVESSFLSESMITPDNETIPLYRGEIRFSDLPADIQERVDELILLYRREREQALGELKLSIDVPEEKIVDIIEDYRVKKISLGGMLIECAHACDIGQTFPMMMTLSEHAPIHITGKVASCLPVEVADTEKYDVGIEFKDLSEKNRKQLKEFIRLLENPNEPPIDIRKQGKDSPTT